MNIPIDDVVHFDVITSNPYTGAAVDADAVPTFAVYEEATDTDIGIGGNMTKRVSLTGNYRGTFTASAANGFEAGKWYAVIVSATVDTIVGKARALHFRCVLAEVTAGVPLVQTNVITDGAIVAATFATAALNAISDNLLKRDWTGLTGEASRSVLNALRFLRNKWTISGTALTVEKEDDATDAWTATVTKTSGDPVTGVDPA